MNVDMVDANDARERTQSPAMIGVFVGDEHGIEMGNAPSRKASLEHISILARIDEHPSAPALDEHAVSLPHVEHDDCVGVVVEGDEYESHCCQDGAEACNLLLAHARPGNPQHERDHGRYDERLDRIY